MMRFRRLTSTAICLASTPLTGDWMARTIMRKQGDGDRYKKGRGLHILADGQPIANQSPL